MSPVRLGLLMSLLALGSAAPARAALDPDSKAPYQLQVILAVAPHRSLTPLFQEQLQRDVGNQLRLALGALARVEMKAAHPLLPEIQARGLEQALDAWDEISDKQVHFVLLGYSAGTYQLEARRHDGMTGQAAPVVHRATTCDRAAVARLAAQLVEQDFALVGTVTGVGKEVHLTLQGGGLGLPLDRWVRRGDVFALSQLTRTGKALRGTRLNWALLEVAEAPHDGVCRCRYWHRYPQDRLQTTPGVEGYRAVKLATTHAPLRVRLLDGATPLDGIQLRVTCPSTAKKTEVATNREGLAVTREEYSHFVLVQVLAGAKQLAQILVAILDDRPVVCRIKVHVGDDALAPLEFRRDAWLRRIYDELQVASVRVTNLNAQLNKSLESALQAGQAGLKNASAELADLTTEHAELLRQARTKTPPAKLDLAEGEQRLLELRQRHKELQAFVARVESVVKEAASEKTLRLHKLLERARLLEGEAEFEQAINTYREVLKASPDQPKVRAHLNRLQQAWKPLSEEHTKARQFIYQTWPTLDVNGLKDNLAKARAALAICRAAHDKLTPLKLQRTNAVHAGNLKKEQLDTLKRPESDDKNNQAKALTLVAEGLLRLHAETAAWLAARPE
jgi:hypothetical protein